MLLVLENVLKGFGLTDLYRAMLRRARLYEIAPCRLSDRLSLCQSVSVP